MSDTELQKLEDLLRRLEDAGEEALPAEDARLVARIRSFTQTLRGDQAQAETHYTLEELRELVRQRMLEHEQWEMPEHLAACPLCLEAYEVVLTGVPAVASASLERFGREGNPDWGRTLGKRRFLDLGRTAWLGIAALLALVAALGLQFYGDPSSAQVHAGGLALESNSKRLEAGKSIPRREILVAREDTQTRFDDGSALDVAKDTRFLINESHGDTIIELKQGTLTANVTKQAKDRHFEISTDLGDVIVVGTRFRVIASNESVIVFRNSSGAGSATQPATPRGSNEAITAVRVDVSEGRVRVKNRYDAIVIGAGESAILRGTTIDKYGPGELE